MSTHLDQTVLRNVLSEIADPETGRPLTDLGQVKEITIENNHISITVGLTTHSAILWKQTRGRIEELLRAKFP